MSSRSWTHNPATEELTFLNSNNGLIFIQKSCINEDCQVQNIACKPTKFTIKTNENMFNTL